LFVAAIILILLFSIGTGAVVRYNCPYNSDTPPKPDKARADCIKDVENQTREQSNKPSTATASIKKETFDLCVKMLDRYEATISGLMNVNVGFYVVLLGWAISSKDARQTLAAQPVLCWLSMAVLTIVMVLYGWATNHWIWRWDSIKKTMDELHYIKSECYPGYDLPNYSWLGYFLPVGILYLFVMVFLLALALGGYFDPQSGQAQRYSDDTGVEAVSTPPAETS
jgi:hypothetical protein